MTAGRTCPLDYRYDASIFREHASLATDTLYVVGGLYGNEPALDEIITMFDGERGTKHLVFNGDFNWFNIAPERFRRVNESVLAHDAIRGNVETELGRTAVIAEAGCGCGYPDFVDEGVVERSNAIMQRLRASAMLFPRLQSDLARLPMWRRIDVGGARVAVIHGDPSSLAGWGLGIEALSDASGVDRAARWFDEADTDIFACTHTCLPLLRRIGTGVVVNNGAAGMPNFSAARYGIITRIAINPSPCATPSYGVEIEGVMVEALAVAYDHDRFLADFDAQWPPGSAAAVSYRRRIVDGPNYESQQATLPTMPHTASPLLRPGRPASEPKP
ncbi:MAG TPA: metallophosphoesterase family protein [Casimicrobiaceae bacterium]|nr:metallophosphoesterase family protein [Casimicrobiaceae bacterium]